LIKNKAELLYASRAFSVRGIYKLVSLGRMGFKELNYIYSTFLIIISEKTNIKIQEIYFIKIL